MKNIINVLAYMLILFLIYVTFGITSSFLEISAQNSNVPVILIFVELIILVIAISIECFVLIRMKDWIELKYKKNIKIDEISEDFKNLYKKIYQENIFKLEKIRKKVSSSIILRNVSLYLFFLINWILQIIEFKIKNKEFLIIVFCCEVSILIFVISSIIVKKEKDIYINEYKKIIPKFIKIINPKLQYLNSTDLLEREYKDAEFDSLKYNKYYEDDYIIGDISPEIKAEIANVLIRYEVGDNKETRFSGMFACCSSKTDFLKNIIKIKVNNYAKEEKNKKVQMDSTDFEKYFDVYCEDKILAMRILTADIMELMVEFYNKYNLFFEIVYKNNKIYLRFFTGKMFEPEIWKNSLNLKTIYEYHETVKFIIKVTEMSNKIVREIDL